MINPEDDNGNVILSFKRAQEQISWENVEKMLEEDRTYDSQIVGFNKGGLIVLVGGLRGFVPSSQISAMRRVQSSGDTPEQRWQKMIGQPISVRNHRSGPRTPPLDSLRARCQHRDASIRQRARH